MHHFEFDHHLCASMLFHCLFLGFRALPTRCMLHLAESVGYPLRTGQQKKRRHPHQDRRGLSAVASSSFSRQPGPNFDKPKDPNIKLPACHNLTFLLVCVPLPFSIDAIHTLSCMEDIVREDLGFGPPLRRHGNGDSTRELGRVESFTRRHRPHGLEEDVSSVFAYQAAAPCRVWTGGRAEETYCRSSSCCA